MQNFKRSITLAAAVSVALFLMACSSGAPTTPSTPTTANTNTTPAQTEEISEESAIAEIDLASKYLSDDNLKGCSTLKAATIQKQCERNIIFARANQKLDSSICSQLQDPADQEECEISIDGVVVN